jgi:hypothetical protein
MKDKNKQAEALLSLGLTPQTPLPDALKAVEAQIHLLQELQHTLRQAAKPIPASRMVISTRKAPVRNPNLLVPKPLSPGLRLLQYLEAWYDSLPDKEAVTHQLVEATLAPANHHFVGLADLQQRTTR